MKWIPLTERQPDTGQLVLLRGRERWEGADKHEDLWIAKIGGDPNSLILFSDTTGATHWIPIPTMTQKTNPLREKLRSMGEFKVVNDCELIEKQLRKRSPLIDWTVNPVGFSYWNRLITAELEVNGRPLHCEREIDRVVLEQGSIDVIEYVRRELVYYIAEELSR